MISIEHDHADYLVIRASGTLTATDYDAAVPEIENAIGLLEGAPKILVVLEDFHGWDLDAAWKDLRFDIKHHGDFSRIAIVGESTLEKWVSRLSGVFTGAETRYFDRAERPAAERWLQS